MPGEDEARRRRGAGPAARGRGTGRRRCPPAARRPDPDRPLRRRRRPARRPRRVTAALRGDGHGRRPGVRRRPGLHQRHLAGRRGRHGTARSASSPGALLRLGESARSGSRPARRAPTLATTPDGEGHLRVARADAVGGAPGTTGEPGRTRPRPGETPPPEDTATPAPVTPPAASTGHVPYEAHGDGPSAPHGGSAPHVTHGPGRRAGPARGTHDTPGQAQTRRPRRPPRPAGARGRPSGDGRRRGAQARRARQWARRLTGGRTGPERPRARRPPTRPAPPVRPRSSRSPPPAPGAWPDPATVLLTALGPGPRLWERDPAHPEALVGTALRDDGAGRPARRAGHRGTAGGRLAGARRAAGAARRARPLGGRAARRAALPRRPGDRADQHGPHPEPRGARGASGPGSAGCPICAPCTARTAGCSSPTTASRRPPAPPSWSAAWRTRGRWGPRRGGAPDRSARPTGERPGGPPGPGTATRPGRRTTGPVHRGDRGRRPRLGRAARDRRRGWRGAGAAAGIHLICLAETPAASPTSPVRRDVRDGLRGLVAFRECGAVALLSGDVRHARCCARRVAAGRRDRAAVRRPPRDRRPRPRCAGSAGPAGQRLRRRRGRPLSLGPGRSASRRAAGSAAHRRRRRRTVTQRARQPLRAELRRLLDELRARPGHPGVPDWPVRRGRRRRHGRRLGGRAWARSSAPVRAGPSAWISPPRARIC